MKWKGCVDRMREKKNPLKILLVKHEKKTELVRPPSRRV